MDALIMTCGTGGGHNAAGKAVAEELTRRGHNVTVLNPYTLTGDKLPSVIDNTYISIAKNAPSVFGFVYHLGEAYRRLPIPSPVYLLNGMMKDVMADYLGKNKFDVILMPRHPRPQDRIHRDGLHLHSLHRGDRLRLLHHPGGRARGRLHAPRDTSREAPFARDTGRKRVLAYVRQIGGARVARA